MTAQFKQRVQSLGKAYNRLRKIERDKGVMTLMLNQITVSVSSFLDVKSELVTFRVRLLLRRGFNTKTDTYVTRMRFRGESSTCVKGVRTTN